MNSLVFPEGYTAGQLVQIPELRDRLLAWRLDPVKFVHEALDVPYLTPDQEGILRDLLIHDRIGVTSGHGTGKSFVAACAVIWFLVCFPESRVITTAASWLQVENVTWGEIRSLVQRAEALIGGKLLQTSLTLGEKWSAIGIATNTSTRMQGMHAPRVLCVIDEAVGVDKEIFEGMGGLTIGDHDVTLALCNPTDASCHFFDELEIPGKWHIRVMSGLNHPNVIEGRVVVPGAITRKKIQEYKDQYGEDHPEYQARVLGKWARGSGRMFSDFDSRVGGAHVYDPAVVKEPPVYAPRWGACDWGFSHNAALFVFAWDGETVWVTHELVVPQHTPHDLAELYCKTLKTDHITLDRFYLSHDAFDKDWGPFSRADVMGAAMKKAKQPYPMKCDKDRVDGWLVIVSLLRRANGIKISKHCKNLIENMRTAKRDPDRPEDALKGPGDDCIDALRYGVKSHRLSVRKPIEEKIKDEYQKYGVDDKSSPMQRLILAQRVRDEDRKAANVRRPLRTRRGITH